MWKNNFKESFYRKGYFEELVGSKVYDIMVPDERKQLTKDVYRHVEKFRNGKH